MPEAIKRHCPQCGRKAHDNLLVHCPDCRVPFIFDVPTNATLTPEQLSLLAQQVFGSWKFWVFILAVAGLSAFGIVAVADRVIDHRANDYINQLDEKATNHLGAAFGQISNQIALEFRQPRIRTAIEQVARERANDLFTNGVRPSLEAFQDAMDMANGQLLRSSNALADLEAQTLAAERRVQQAPAPAPPPLPITQTAPARVVPAQAQAMDTNSIVKLVLINRNITQAGAGYILTLFFRQTNGPSIGMVDIAAGTYKQTAKILNFAAMTSGVNTPPVLDELGDVARLRFSVTDKEPPTLVMEVSAPTIVRFMSDSIDEDMTIPIAADKMQLAPSLK